MKNLFYKKKNNIKLNDILSSLNLNKQKINYIVSDIKELQTASNKDISFFNSIKYLDLLKKTKSKLIITDKKFQQIIPKKIKSILVSNVLLAVALTGTLLLKSFEYHSSNSTGIILTSSKF